MVIMYLGFGIISGLLASVIALLSGAGIFLAFIAYVLAGIAGMLAGVLCSTMPRQARAVAQSVTRRG